MKLTSLPRFLDLNTKEFIANNPGLDLTTIDLHDEDVLKKLTWKPKKRKAIKRKDASRLAAASGLPDKQSVLNQLKTLQRVMRITPDTGVAEKLIAHGYDSAQKIASISERKFVRLFAPVIKDEQKASEIYTQAVHIAETAMHLYANIKDTVASPHYNATSFKVTDSRLASYYKSIPSFQELFGSLNYLQCDECQSIFSPAAYFLDIMRITDEYITDPNINPVRTIPPRYTLQERRPDLFSLKLDCENTNTVIPYLQLVNEILKKNIEHNEGISDAYQTLAISKYPFQLPFNLPLDKTREYLKQLEIPLYQVFQSILTTGNNAANVHAFDVACEFLYLSFQQFKLVSKEDYSIDALTASYGYNVSYHPPAFDGNGRLLFLDKQNIVTGVGTLFTSEVKVNDQINVAGEIKKVTRIDSDTQLVTDTNWMVTSGSAYKVVPDAAQTFDGQGTLAFTIDSNTIRGTGTAFKSQASIGDKIISAKQTRTVVSINSDTELTVDQPWPFITDGVPYKITTQTKTPFAGNGVVVVTKGSISVTGMGTNFNVDFTAGSSIEIDGVAKSVVSVQSNTLLTVSNEWDLDLGAVFTITPQPTLKKVTQYLPHTGTGTLSLSTGATQVTGSGTKFTAELSIGDQVTCAGQTRTVATITSDTELTVTAAWQLVTSGASFDILPADGLDIVDNFIERTNLDRTELENLFKQDLSRAELEAGEAYNFFINNTGEQAPYLQTGFVNDPGNQLQRIKGITVKRLDRLNRFIRLGQITGWNFTDLNWLFYTYNTAGVTNIDESLVIYLAQVKTLQQTLEDRAVPELTALWTDLKTTGRISDKNPSDLFDRVYNNPQLLNGKDPYTTDVPFNPFRDPVQEWTIASIDGTDGVIRSRLAAALGLDMDNIASLGNYVYLLTGGKNKKLALNLANLSWMYRISQWAALLDLTLDELQNLLCLRYYPAANYLQPPPGSIQPNADTFGALSNVMQKLEKHDLNIYQVNYILKGETGTYYEPPYRSSDIVPFINELASAAISTHLKASDFVFENTDSAQAAYLFSMMQGKYISESGVFTRYEFSYENAAQFFPVIKNGESWALTFYPESFSLSFENITTDESKKVFDALIARDKAILTSDGPGTAILSPTYTDNTDLGFLITIFEGSEDAPLKVGEIQSLLSQTKSSIEHTLKVWRDTEQKQQELLEGWLGQLIDSGKGTVRALKKFASAESGLNDYLVAFFTPVNAASPVIEEFIETLSRGAVLADHLSLTEKEIRYITSTEGHSHFNIENLSDLIIGNVISLIDYTALKTSFADRDDQLIDYFQLPKDSACPNPKINKLSSITGWDARQVCVLIDLFWPAGSDTNTDYDTIAGLQRLQASFNAGKKLGADMKTLVSFSSIGHLDLDPQGVFNIQNWNIYGSIADKAMSLAGSKLGDEAFTSVSSSVQEVLNSEIRNALLPFSVWLINAKNPDIVQPSDLYRYLLIDVEMSGCALTSRIAQGIASVQLYMQRCRMMLEPGVDIVDVPKIWWDWISSYRIWEVNRKIFLYPENYIEPTLRKKVTPAFKSFSDDLLQNDINKSTVKEPYEKYLQEINVLGNLIHVASYNTTRLDANTGEEKETLFLFGRTNTQPYTYYMRTLDDMEDWGPWLKIDITINASSITPVYAFDRIFVFWSEKSITQSSAVKEQESSTETVEIVDLKFSFFDERKWMVPQVLFTKTPINAFPSNYPSIQNPEITARLNDQNAYWNIPYVLSSGKGVIGAGRVDISADMQVINGKNTQFLREVKTGDTVWCMGEKRIVGGVADNYTMVVTRAWSKSASDCEYKIVPHGNDVQSPPFVGTGKVTITKDLQNVAGTDTRFTDEFTYGDNIVIGDETRMVILINSDTDMLVDKVWQSSATDAVYTISPKKNKEEQLIVMLGANIPTSYSGDVKKPDIQPNPTKNLFISERNALNESLYSSLKLAKLMGPSGLQINGDATMGPIHLVDGNLLNSESNLVLTDYKYASGNNPEPYRPALDRQQATLVVVPDDNPVKSNYWGNNIAGTANNSGNINMAGTKRLLYYINQEKSSLINVSNQPGWFLYNNSDEAFLVQAQQNDLNKLTDMALIRPYPMLPDMLNNKVISTQAFTVNPVSFTDLKFKFTRLTTNVTSLLMQKLFAGGIDNLLTLRSQEIPELPFSRFYPAPGNEPPQSVIPPVSSTMDFNGAFGLYFWEIFFHGPFLIADRLNMNKRYEDAKQWLEYVFNPTVNEDDSASPDPEQRYWRFLPFRTMKREALKEILTNPAQIRRYNFDPFDPDVIAKYRHTAYAKAIVMKYIDNILDWGDFLFTQDTSESINQATNLYVLVCDLLGKRPELQGKIPTPEAKSFEEIKKAYPQQIPQFLIELENTPEVHTENAVTCFSGVPFNKINSYFCVPENSDFMSYWDRVEDRLFKIRHCQNIQGVYRQLPLFSPPIDPRALIRAYASGGGGFGLLSSFNAPIPYFRFSYLIEKARSLTAQVSNLGNALLAALEKKDAEALNIIRLQQEKSVLQLTTMIKETQISAIEQQKASQQESMNSATYRYNHYTQLLTDGISHREQVSMDAALAAMILNTIGSITKTAASIGYAVPQAGSPFAMTYGGEQIGNALNAASGAFEIGAIISNYISQQSLTMAGYDRRAEDWTLQQNVALYDKAQIEAQIRQTDLQIQIAKQDLVVHQQTIKNTDEMEAYYKDKFTGKELYQWLATRISSVYFQTYNLAYNMAKAAERAYQYQFNTDRTFINYGYWDDLYKGLGAADGLMLALDQMDSNYSLERGYRTLEIEKTISLLQLNPKALLDLKTKGECIFEFNEKLFDYDFPGHYVRKIKTISISIPAVIGPYQNIHATLTQLNNQVVLKNDKQGLDAVNYLLGGDVNKIPDSSVLRSNWWTNQQIALSKGVSDSGLFQLNFDDTRFLPFEGTGAVSTWKLSMPFSTNRIHFEAISDVVIQLKYTAMDGGEKFRDDVMKLKPFKPYSGVGYRNLSQMYPTAWYSFMKNHASTTAQELKFDLADFVPPHIAKARLIGFYFRLDAAVSAPGTYISFKVSDTLSIPVLLTPNNDCTYSFKKDGKPEPVISKVLGERTISFDLAATPSELKGSDNFLNPEAVRNIEIILYYDGEPDNS